MKRFLSAILLLGISLVLGAKPATSPNGKLSAGTEDGKLVVRHEKQTVLEMSDVPFKKLKFVRQVKDDYRMLEGKRLHCANRAREYQAPIGLDEPQTLATDLGFIGKGKALLFADDASGQWKIGTIDSIPSRIDCQPRGGFLLILEK